MANKNTNINNNIILCQKIISQANLKNIFKNVSINMKVRIAILLLQLMELTDIPNAAVQHAKLIIIVLMLDSAKSNVFENAQLKDTIRIR